MQFDGIGNVVAITVICYIVGIIVKNTKIADKWIPVCCGIVGGIIGAIGMNVIPNFPANDIITAIAVGIVSGLAATGVNQAIKQLGKDE